MKRNLLGLLFFLYTRTVSFAQNDILVELNDSETAEPIPYATIRFKGTSRGLVADYYGQFRLPYRNVDGLSVIRITSMGYQTLEVDIKTLLLNTINKIKLVPQIETLKTVILNSSKPNLSHNIRRKRRMLPSNIVRLAINAIPYNLNAQPHSYVGYYRDYQFIEGEYYNLKEGILEQFDGGIASHKIKDTTNQAAFYSLKKNNDFKFDPHFTKAYDGFNKYVEGATLYGFGGNELTILNVHNPIRNHNKNSFAYVYQLNKDFIENHKFSKSDIIFSEGEPLIKINFKTKDYKLEKRDSSEFLDEPLLKTPLLEVSGSLLISLIDYSIHGFNYTMFDDNSSNPLFNVSIEYRRQDGKMYLNYISFNNRFESTDDFFFDVEEISFTSANNYFKITFNDFIDPKTIKKSNFSFSYKGKRVLVRQVYSANKSVYLRVRDYNKALVNLKKEDMEAFTFLLKNIKSVKGKEIYLPEITTGYQFREFFVQEVFADKPIDSSLNYILKNKPLQEAGNNNSFDKDKYIINSPLIKQKME